MHVQVVGPKARPNLSSTGVVFEEHLTRDEGARVNCLALAKEVRKRPPGSLRGIQELQCCGAR